MPGADGRPKVAPAGRTRWGGAVALEGGQLPACVLVTAVLLLVLGGPLRAGTVRLQVSPGEEVKAARLIERESGATYVLAKVPSEKEGEDVFEKGDLPVGVYDVVLLTHRGRIEGVNLKVEGVPVDAPPLRERDKKEIRRLVLGMTSFADRRRILFLQGRGSEARVLVEEVTTRKTTLGSSAPFLIWRVEVWYYRKEFGAWDRYDWDVIVRQRPTVADFEKTTWVFEPALGGLALSETTPVVEVTYTVPESFDPAAGVVAGETAGEKTERARPKQ